MLVRHDLHPPETDEQHAHPDEHAPGHRAQVRVVLLQLVENDHGAALAVQKGLRARRIPCRKAPSSKFKAPDKLQARGSKLQFSKRAAKPCPAPRWELRAWSFF